MLETSEGSLIGKNMDWSEFLIDDSHDIQIPVAEVRFVKYAKLGQQ